MDYYHNLITEKSWKELQELRRRLDFVLIGGWAVYVYAKTLKSKDIDIIVDYDKLPVLAKLYDLRKNDRLKKYQASREEVEIDIYLPHYSRIGIPVEDLLKQIVNLGGFRILEINHLLGLKIFTFSLRGNSTKGRKDFIDIVSLAAAKLADWEKIKRIIGKYRLEEPLANWTRALENTFEVGELKLNKHSFSKLKKEILGKLG